jgi:L-lactate dehydrogenase complex protein LldE
MRVQLMLTCLCDAFYGEVGIATATVLEHAGCTVEFPEGQTCCGQPPFNAGDWGAAWTIAERCAKIFDPSIPIVTPSASCAAMLRHGNSLLGLPTLKAFELSEFMLDQLTVASWPLSGNRVHRPRKIAFHRACHGRMLHLGDKQEKLLGILPGLELVAFEQPEQCCGFGGAFSASHPTISAGIGMEKLRCILDSGADTIVSGDLGCLMHLDGLIRRQRLPLRTLHYAALFSEALQ